MLASTCGHCRLWISLGFWNEKGNVVFMTPPRSNGISLHHNRRFGSSWRNRKWATQHLSGRALLRCARWNDVSWRTTNDAIGASYHDRDRVALRCRKYNSRNSSRGGSSGKLEDGDTDGRNKERARERERNTELGRWWAKKTCYSPKNEGKRRKEEAEQKTTEELEYRAGSHPKKEKYRNRENECGLFLEILREVGSCVCGGLRGTDNTGERGHKKTMMRAKNEDGTVLTQKVVMRQLVRLQLQPKSETSRRLWKMNERKLKRIKRCRIGRNWDWKCCGPGFAYRADWHVSYKLIANSTKT